MPGEWHGRGLIDLAALRASLDPGSHVLTGLSGGADSVALLLSLLSVRAELQINVSAVHVNHHLRPEADDEESFVRKLCTEHDIILDVCHLKDAGKVQGGSAEAHWRKLRYDAFSEIIGARGASHLALGHNGDDLAETFLFHLVRGSGVNGLTFQFESHVGDLRIIRPLWKTPRARIETMLTEYGQTWIEDPSNLDTRHSRNLIRHTVMPALKQISPAAPAAIIRASEAISHALFTARQNHRLNKAVGDEQPPAFSVRCYRDNNSNAAILAADVRWFTEKHGLKLDSKQTMQVVNMVTSAKAGTMAVTGKSTLVVTQDYLWISRRQDPDNLELTIDHIRLFGGIYARLDAPVVLALPSAATTVICTLDGTDYRLEAVSKVQLKIVNRDHVADAPSWRSRLKKIFNEYRIPWYLRSYLLLVWAENYGVIGIVGGFPELDGMLRQRAQLDWSITISPVLNERPPQR